MPPPFWRKVTLFDPVVCRIDGFLRSFYGISDVGVSLGMTAVFMAPCLGCIGWIFRTGHRLKT